MGNEPHRVVAVLAGGRSERMGIDKADVVIGGMTMLDRVLAAVQSPDRDVVVVGHRTGRAVDTIPDLRPNQLGPLAGIEAALAYGAGRDVIVVAVDQPFVRGETLDSLFSVPGDAVVPSAAGRLQVTCALYRAPCLGVAAELLDRGSHPVAALLDRVAVTVIEETVWTEWGEDGRSWHSLDTPAAVSAAERRFGLE